MKRLASRWLPRSTYEWLALQYSIARKLFIYPSTARVGQPMDYDAYWDAKLGSGIGRMSDWRLRRAQALASAMRPGARVLDVGVGDGALLKYLVDHHGVVGVGLDISPKAVEFCRDSGLEVRLADVNRPISEFIDGSFDYVVLTEIIEHLPEPEQLLDDLRPFVDEMFLISIPNTGYWHHRLRLLLGKFPLQWVVTPGEHLRYWTLADFRWWASELGFDLVAALPYVGVKGLRRWWPSLFAAGFVYALRDARGAAAEPLRGAGDA